MTDLLDDTIGAFGGFVLLEHLQPLSKYAMYSMNEEVHFGAWPSFSVYLGAAYALGPKSISASGFMPLRVSVLLSLRAPRFLMR